VDQVQVCLAPGAAMLQRRKQLGIIGGETGQLLGVVTTPATKTSRWGPRLRSLLDSEPVMAGILRALATITWWPSAVSKRLTQGAWVPHSRAMRRDSSPSKCRLSAA
jgi:hypothetical protein